MRKPTSRIDAWAYWRDAIAGRPGAITHEPRCGLYQARRNRASIWRPVAIDLLQTICPATGELLDDERLIALDGRRLIESETEICELWLYAARYPITQSRYDLLCAIDDRRISGGALTLSEVIL